MGAAAQVLDLEPYRPSPTAHGEEPFERDKAVFLEARKRPRWMEKPRWLTSKLGKV